VYVPLKTETQAFLNLRLRVTTALKEKICPEPAVLPEPDLKPMIDLPPKPGPASPLPANRPLSEPGFRAFAVHTGIGFQKKDILLTQTVRLWIVLDGLNPAILWHATR
jgi:hypothetical protein